MSVGYNHRCAVQVTRMGLQCAPRTTASASAAALHQQFLSLHATVFKALRVAQPSVCINQTPHATPMLRSVTAAALPQRRPGWLSQQQRRLQLPRQQDQQQQKRQQPNLQKTSHQQQQQRPIQQQQQQQVATLQQQQTQLPPQQTQQQQQQQQRQPAKFTWGYLDGDTADEWTWDDDYNAAAIAKAAAEARALPPTPRQQQLAAAAAAAAQQRPTVITRLPEQFNRQVLSNGVLLVDKPLRWSSADVVRQLRSALKVDRVCFGAPLDTQATGLLIILLGAASRLTPKLEPLERTYSGTFRLGVSTTTYDASGETLESNPWQDITDADISTAAQGFIGEVSQLPCMWSSSKYRNKPLRWYAERGEVVAREPKSVHIASIQTWRAAAATGDEDSSSSSSGQAVSDTVCFRMVASKGASARVLVHDLGKALGCGAHVTSLRREGVGGFSVETAWSLDVLLPLARKYSKGFRQPRQQY